MLVRFAHGTGWWAYCQYHDARSGPRRFRGWQPWQIAEVIEEELIVYWPEFDEPGRPR